MNQSLKVDRRKFLVAALSTSGAFVIGTQGSAMAKSETMPWDKDPPDAAGSAEFTPWLTINPDDTVIVRVAAVDIGNGTLTQACAFVMEELGSSWANLVPEYADPNRNYKEGDVFSKPGTILAYFSGRSTNQARADTYLQCAASARERLKAAAAKMWDVPVGEVEAKDSVVTHAASGKSARFGELVSAAALITLDAEPKPKDASQWTFLTKQHPAKVQIPADRQRHGGLWHGYPPAQHGLCRAAGSRP